VRPSAAKGTIRRTGREDAQDLRVGGAGEGDQRDSMFAQQRTIDPHAHTEHRLHELLRHLDGVRGLGKAVEQKDEVTSTIAGVTARLRAA